MSELIKCKEVGRTPWLQLSLSSFQAICLCLARSQMVIFYFFLFFFFCNFFNSLNENEGGFHELKTAIIDWLFYFKRKWKNNSFWVSHVFKVYLWTCIGRGRRFGDFIEITVWINTKLRKMRKLCTFPKFEMSVGANLVSITKYLGDF